MSSHKQSQPQQQFNASLAAAQTPSPIEQKRTEMALKTLTWADKGDFTNPQEGGIFVNLADPAMRQKQRELQMGAGAQGTAALGTANATALNLDRQNRADENAQDAAGEYEHNIASGVNAAMGVAGDESHTDLQRKLGVLGSTQSVYQTKMNQLSWFDKMLIGAQQRAQSASAAGGAP